jgi:hypothetical protein
MNNSNTVPAGYRTNAQGHLIPESQVKPVDKLRDEVVMTIVAAARQQRQLLAAFKLESMQKIADFTDLSASEYGVEYGGTKGNVTLVSFDGRYKLIRAVGEHRVFDERIQAAKALIDTCISEWSGGADERIMALLIMLSALISKVASTSTRFWASVSSISMTRNGMRRWTLLLMQFRFQAPVSICVFMSVRQMVTISKFRWI